MNSANQLKALWPLLGAQRPQFLELWQATLQEVKAAIALIALIIAGCAMLPTLIFYVPVGLNYALSKAESWAKSLSLRGKIVALVAFLAAVLSLVASLLGNYVLALLLALTAAGIAASAARSSSLARWVEGKITPMRHPMQAWADRHGLALMIVATVQSILTFAVVGWLAWHGQLQISPVVGALATPLAAIQARYLLAALTAAVGQCDKWIKDHRFDSQAWRAATLQQLWQVPLTTGTGYLLGALFLAAYLLTWHGGPAEQRAVLYLFQAGIGGVATNVVVAMATVQKHPLPRKDVSPVRQHWRMVGLAAMVLVSIIPVFLIVFLFVAVGILGYQGGYIDFILGVMIVGIAGLTAALTNWFSYRKQRGVAPVHSWKPGEWSSEEWLRLGHLAELYWSRELLPGVIRTAAFFLGFPFQGLYLTTARHPVHQIAQLVLSASQQGCAAVLNLPAVAVRNAPEGWFTAMTRKVRRRGS